MSDRISARKWSEQLRGWFPEREIFFMRSQGQVRFIRISARFQMRAAALALAVVLGWLVSLAVMAWGQYRAEADLASFEQEKGARCHRPANGLMPMAAILTGWWATFSSARISSMKWRACCPRISSPKAARPGPSPISSAEAAKTVEKVGALIPQARGLAEIEARQLAVVERLTRFADARARRARSRDAQAQSRPRRAQPPDPRSDGAALSRRLRSAAPGSIRGSNGSASASPAWQCSSVRWTVYRRSFRPRWKTSPRVSAIAAIRSTTAPRCIRGLISGAMSDRRSSLPPMAG